MYECKYSKRSIGGRTVLCTKAPKIGQQLGICGNQYFCGRTMRWEHTAAAERCPLASDAQQGDAAEPDKKPARDKAKKKPAES